MGSEAEGDLLAQTMWAVLVVCTLVQLAVARPQAQGTAASQRPAALSLYCNVTGPCTPCKAEGGSEPGCRWTGHRQPIGCVAEAAGRPLHSGEVERAVAKDVTLAEGSALQSFQSCSARKRKATLATFELWIAGVGALSATVLLVRRRALAR
ncbi:hypothetical protein WJX81_008238 [Elliptochloris bilobata]|uniref:Uncharacterized protein n=1 Tax=Elliptochloris bilobata TaxID=381761 RepID=A0AAW1SI17_9CHLO